MQNSIWTTRFASLSLSPSFSNIAYMLILYLEVTVRVLGNIWMSSAASVKRLWGMLSLFHENLPPEPGSCLPGSIGFICVFRIFDENVFVAE